MVRFDIALPPRLHLQCGRVYQGATPHHAEIFVTAMKYDGYDWCAFVADYAIIRTADCGRSGLLTFSAREADQAKRNKVWHPTCEEADCRQWHALCSLLRCLGKAVWPFSLHRMLTAELRMFFLCSIICPSQAGNLDVALRDTMAPKGSAER